jgi:hypothetical protein
MLFLREPLERAPRRSFVRQPAEGSVGCREPGAQQGARCATGSPVRNRKPGAQQGARCATGSPATQRLTPLPALGAPRCLQGLCKLSLTIRCANLFLLSPKRVACHYVPAASFLTVQDTLLRQHVIRERVPFIKKITPRAPTKPNNGSRLSSLPGYDEQRVRGFSRDSVCVEFIFCFCCCLLLQYRIQSSARGEEDSGGHVL